MLEDKTLKKLGLENLPDNIIPVSYTHLDVYKRQEVSLNRGVMYHLTGLGDEAVKESRNLISAALQ